YPRIFQLHGQSGDSFPPWNRRRLTLSVPADSQGAHLECDTSAFPALVQYLFRVNHSSKVNRSSTPLTDPFKLFPMATPGPPPLRTTTIGEHVLSCHAGITYFLCHQVQSLFGVDTQDPTAHFVLFFLERFIVHVPPISFRTPGSSVVFSGYRILEPIEFPFRTPSCLDGPTWEESENYCSKEYKIRHWRTAYLRDLSQNEPTTFQYY